MAKKAYVYSGTDWVPLASEVTDLTAYSTSTEIANTYATKADNGLVHINTTSFSAVTAVDIGSDASPLFSADYNNYLILVEANSDGAGQTLSARMRANTTNATGANYDYQFMQGFGATVNAAESTSQTSWAIGDLGAGTSGLYEIMSINLFKPFLATRTFFNTTQGGKGIVRMRGGVHQLTTSYNGIGFFATSNFSGFIRIYGYRN